jgi:hypothetical protein
MNAISNRRLLRGRRGFRRVCPGGCERAVRPSNYLGGARHDDTERIRPERHGGLA